MPLRAKLAVLPSRGGPAILERPFQPLGCCVETLRHPLDDEARMGRQMTKALHPRRAPVLRPALALGLALAFTLAAAAGPMDAAEAESAAESSIMKAGGTFEVKLSPLETYTKDPAAKIGRMAIDKSFSGDLEARSQGEMLSGGSPSEGSAGYVAIERVTGTLGGRQGSFLLQHSGTMTPTAQGTTITVVPASGTGELAGIAGAMSIRIEDGRHFYEFEYTLPSG